MVYSSGEEGNDDIMSNLLKVQNVKQVLSNFHVYYIKLDATSWIYSNMIICGHTITVSKVISRRKLL